MKTMALSREITLTIDNYNIILDKEIKIYEYDAINLCFTIQECGIVMRDGKAHNRVMPVVALKAYMLIETPQGTDSVEATNIVRNKIMFSLGNKYSRFVGTGKMQIILKDFDGCRITLPEFAYEVKQSINTGWDDGSFDVLITEKEDTIITDELGRPVETTKISEFDETNEVTPQTYTMVINEDGNKKIKLDTMMESISEMIEFDVEEIDRRIDEMIEVYDDEEVEVEFPSLHNDVERIKGEINEINESLDTIETKKLDKNGIVTMANMGQDVKESMTGGSVAVVGRNAILTENIIDEQVTPTKLNIFDVTKENLWVIDNASYKGMSVNYSYDDNTTTFKGAFTEKTRMLIKQLYLTKGTWSIVAFNINGLKPTMYIYSEEEYYKSNWSSYVGVYAKANNSSDITIPNDGYYCIVVYAEANENYDSSGKFVLSNNSYNKVTSFIANTYKLKNYVNFDVNTTNIQDKSITIEKTDFIEKTKDNLWDFDNIVDDNFSLKYNFEDGTTCFLGSVSTIKRYMFKQVHLTGGAWCIKSFNYSGVKPTIYIYKKTDYENSRWQEYVTVFTIAGYGCNFDIVEDGEYCLVAYLSENVEYNYSGKIVLSKNNYENIDKYIPIKYKFRGYVDVEEPSEELVFFKELQGKKISILGVSIDTYKDYIVSGNATYYTSSNLADVEMTWWKKLLNKTGMVLDVNNSWSGACASTKKNLASSGVQRCTNLGDNPDFIIISAFALNDWSNSNLTKYDKDNMVIPNCGVDLSITENYTKYQDTIESYGGALATIFYRIMEKYHDTKIFVCDAYNYYRDGKVPFTPTVAEPKINICNDILYDVARQFGIEVIKVSECGINAFNSRQYCVETNGSIGLHPNDEGHTLYFKKVLDGFVKYI